MESVVITIPRRPVPKARHHFDPRSGRSYADEKTRRAEQRVRAMAMAAMRGRGPFTGPVSIELVHVMPIAESWPALKRAHAIDGVISPTDVPDLDNLDKMVLDGLNPDPRSGTPSVWLDDSQVVEKTSRKIYGLDAMTRAVVSPYLGAPIPLFEAAAQACPEEPQIPRSRDGNGRVTKAAMAPGEKDAPALNSRGSSAPPPGACIDGESRQAALTSRDARLSVDEYRALMRRGMP